MKRKSLAILLKLAKIFLIIIFFGVCVSTDLFYEAESGTYELQFVDRWSITWLDDEIGGWQFWFYDGKYFIYRYPPVEKLYPLRKYKIEQGLYEAKNILTMTPTGVWDELTGPNFWIYHRGGIHHSLSKD